MTARPQSLLALIALIGIAIILAGCTPNGNPEPAFVHNTPAIKLENTAPPPTNTAEIPPTHEPTFTPTPTPLPDLVAFSGANGRGGSTLWLMDEYGQDLHTPFPNLDQAGYVSWSPQGSWLGFTFDEGDQHALMLYNPFTFQERLVPNASNLTWRWSPDGSQLAYFANSSNTCHLSIYSLSNGAVRYLDAVRNHDACERTAVGVMTMTTWTADGRYLYLDAGTGISRNLTVVDVINDRTAAQFDSIIYRSVVISPDGKYLVSDVTEGAEADLGNPTVTIIDAQTGERKIVTTGVISQDWYQIIDWLPDGRILYMWSHEAVRSYWYFNPQTDQQPVPADDYQPPPNKVAEVLSLLPDTMTWLWPSLSADGTRLAASVREGENYFVYLFDVETRSLSAPIASGVSPQWQPISRESMGAAGVISAASQPAATDTPEPAVTLATMKMMFWEVWFSYDPNVWQVGGHQYMPSITHRQIPQCIIREQGPTEHPDVTMEIDLGDVHYKVVEIMRNGAHADWYMATYGPNGTFAYGMPSLVVNGVPEQWDTCLADAQVVLATLTDSAPVSSTSGLGTNSTASYFTCEGALSPRLWVDGYAFVSYEPPLANRVRSGPGTNYPVLGTIAPGKAMKIIGGPECASGWVWWQVQALGTSLTGWTAEGDAPDYWLIPCQTATGCGR